VVDGYNEAALPAPSPMKIAAIDIGSNSIHVVVEVMGSGGFEVVEREKQIERRGAGTLARGPARLLVARA
jgi:exopolyphosphatase/pppGpp-phosphohydrolase